jgi:hypothetical protein
MDMASRDRLPPEDRRRWGMPTIWIILVVIVVALCFGCSGVLKWFKPGS